jgi:hypothetical protein
MEQTSDPETLIIHQKLTPGNNPKNFKQHNLDVPPLHKALRNRAYYVLKRAARN